MKLKSILPAVFAVLLYAPALAAQTAPSASSPFQAKIAAAKGAMMAEPQKAYDLAKAGSALAQVEPAGRARDIDVITAQWLADEALIRLKQPADALKALDLLVPSVAQAAPNSKLQGDVLKSHGRAAAAVGRVQVALADYQNAFSIYQKAGEPRAEAMALQEIATIYSEARDYPHVLQYNAQSKDVFGQDPTLNLTATNNRAFALKDMGQLPEAIAEFRKALVTARQMQSAYIQAHILTNIAFTEAMQGKRSEARRDATAGLALTESDPEAKSERPFLTGVLAKVAADSGDYPTAAQLLSQVFHGVDLDHSDMDYRDFHEIAAGVFDKVGDKEKALQHLKAFKRLDDEGRTLAASTNSALMSAKFDFANQATRIAQLKAGQLQRDVMLARAKATFTTVVTVILLIGGLIVTTLISHAFFSMRRSRNRIREVNAVLETTNGDLEKALRAKTEFLATTSHEIRTPLNGILGMTQVMLADAAVTGDTRERLRLVKSSGDTMAALVNDLLDVAKIENGHLSVERTEIDLAALLSDVETMWSDQARVRGLSFNLDRSDCPEWILEDGDRLRQVLFNLLSNATKFTEVGSVSLKVGARSVGDGEWLDISVADTGIGIPSDHLQRIFEPFTQVDGGKARQYAGTGLGLAICSNLAEALGGEIKVQSVVDEGSTFTLSLPLVRAKERLTSASGDDLASASLLVVDENPLMQAMLRALLADKVRRLDFMSAGELETSQSLSPHDMILVDSACLERAGADLGRTVARLAGAHSGPLIALVTNADAQECDRLASLGVCDVVQKPIAPAALVAVLKSAWASAKVSSVQQAHVA